MLSADRPDAKFSFLLLVHYDYPAFVIGVVAKAAPFPLVRLQYQAAFYRIEVHVAQLLDALLAGEYNEVIEPPLPDMAYFQSVVP